MILHTEEGVRCVSVTSPKCGQRYTGITLSAEDFVQLSKLDANALRSWFDLWTLGFPPGSYFDYRGPQND